jgi:hypothetical protein
MAPHVRICVFGCQQRGGLHPNGSDRTSRRPAHAAIVFRTLDATGADVI